MGLRGAPQMLGTPCVSFRSPLLNRHENPKKLETFVREKSQHSKTTATAQKAKNRNKTKST